MKKITFFIVIFLIIASFLIVQNFFFLKVQIFSQESFSDLNIQNIHLSSTSDVYALRNGDIYRGQKKLNFLNWNEEIRVLKLALFYQLLKENPLLFDPNLEVEKFDQAVSRMKQINDKWIQQTNYSYVYPIVFLQDFSDSSEQFQKLQNDVSEANAQELIEKIKQTQQAYAKDVEEIGKHFENLASNKNDKNVLMFLGGDTKSTVFIIADDFAKMKENGQFLAKDVSSAESCLEKMQCERPLLNVQKPANINSSTENLPEILPQDELFSPVANPDGGPYLVHSKCWKERDEDLLFEGTLCNRTPGFCLDWPFLSDGDYWVKTDESTQLEKTFKAHGMERRFQTASAPYGCQDLTYKPKLRIIDYFYRNYKNHRLFTNDLPQTNSQVLNDEVNYFWSEGEQVERKFFDAEHPSDVDLDFLARYYAYTYSFLAKNSLLDYETRDEFLQRSNLISGEIKNMDLVFDRSTFHFANYLQENIDRFDSVQNKESFFTNNVLAIRSNYSITFLNFSPFVWKTTEKPQYLIRTANKSERANGISADKSVLIDQQDAKELYGAEKLKIWGQLSNQLRGY